jgi:hypothetical protein
MVMQDWLLKAFGLQSIHLNLRSIIVGAEGKGLGHSQDLYPMN